MSKNEDPSRVKGYNDLEVCTTRDFLRFEIFVDFSYNDGSLRFIVIASWRKSPIATVELSLWQLNKEI